MIFHEWYACVNIKRLQLEDIISIEGGRHRCHVCTSQANFELNLASLSLKVQKGFAVLKQPLLKLCKLCACWDQVPAGKIVCQQHRIVIRQAPQVALAGWTAWSHHCAALLAGMQGLSVCDNLELCTLPAL